MVLSTWDLRRGSASGLFQSVASRAGVSLSNDSEGGGGWGCALTQCSFLTAVSFWGQNVFVKVYPPSPNSRRSFWATVSPSLPLLRRVNLYLLQFFQFYRLLRCCNRILVSFPISQVPLSHSLTLPISLSPSHSCCRLSLFVMSHSIDVDVWFICAVIMSYSIYEW